MKIGFDSRWYFEGPVSNRLVVRKLLKNLINLSSESIYPIFRKKDKQKVIKEFGDIDCIYTVLNNTFLSNVFEVPFISKANKMDLIVFQNFTPIFGNFIKINYIHDIIFYEFPQYFTLMERLYFKPIKFLSNKADAVITISDNEKKRIIRNNFSKNVHFVYHGVDMDLHKSNSKDMGLPNRYILAVGRINKRKNLGNLIKAFSLIDDKEIKLIIVGEKSWKTANIDKLLLNESLKKRIIFYSKVSTTELGQIYRNSTIFCFLSFEEGFGLPVIEAMSFSIPVIISNSSVMPEIAGNAGIKVDPNDIELIRNSINNLLINKDLYENQKKLSYERAQYFSWEKASKEILKIFHNLINNIKINTN